MYSLTETTRRLHIGKRRLYQLLESEGITPTLKSGHKLLTEADFQHISKTLQHGLESAHKSGQASLDTAHQKPHYLCSLEAFVPGVPHLFFKKMVKLRDTTPLLD